MFARRGEATPPCGVPSSVGIKMPLSTTPALSHSFRGRAKCGLVCILSRSAAWFILSKQLAISASSTYRGCLLMPSNICSMASWHERPGLNPKLWGSNLASHSGSRARLTSACVARSCMIGIPTVHYPFFSALFGNSGHYHPSLSSFTRSTGRSDPRAPGTRPRSYYPPARWLPCSYRREFHRLRRRSAGGAPAWPTTIA
jgi:hypothetical protein